jgi:HEAT repeat protein
MSESEGEPKTGRRLQTGVRTLIVLVASCGIIFWAARSLWESQHPAYGAALGLRARSPSDRVDAIRLLVQTGIGDTEVAIPPLIATLTDPEPEVRVGACEALGQLVCGAVKPGPSADAVRAASSALIGSLKDPKPDVRIAALKALDAIVSFTGSAGSIDRDRVFGAASEMLGDPDADVCIAALGALGSTARKVTTAPPAALTANLANESSGVRMAAIGALACFQRDLDRWIPSVFEVLEREDDSRVRNASMRALSQLRPPTYSAAALPALVKALSSRYRDIRSCASGLLGVLGHEACPAIPNLIETMSYQIDTTMVGPGKVHPGGWDPAWGAAWALGKIAPGTKSADEVIEALTEIVRTGHPYRRVAAAHALGEFDTAAVEAVPALISVIQENAATKAAFADGAYAATALGRIAVGTPMADAAVTSLTEALQAESEYTRQEAINAIVRFEAKAAVAVPRLRALVNDPDIGVRAAAARALTALDATE